MDAGRIGRLVLTNCDSFDNFPPGVFKALSRAAKIPGAGFALAQSMRFEPVIRAPFGFGDNSKASLITRGLAELARVGQAMGGNPLTFAGLAGMGDLVATCISPLSRNRTVGEQLNTPALGELTFARAFDL